MTIQIPEQVEHIISTLMDNGFEAYAVGGCVRDSILGRLPDDWDITTSAKPVEVKQLFRRTIDTGIVHGTVTVMIDKDSYEVTTYRIDGEYDDNRHPKNVRYTTNLVEDLKRRDFTINAMAYNKVDGLVDVFGGIKDIDNKRICCVGNAEERFNEDALRMLRAVRFAGQLGFSIEEETKNAIKKNAGNLESISAERIRVELNKLITSRKPELLKEAYLTGISKVVLPELNTMMETKQNNPHHCYSVGDHTLHALENISQTHYEWKKQDERLYSILCWTLLLHDVGKPLTRTTDEEGIDHFYGHAERGFELAKDIMRRLKFDNYSIDMVSRLIKWHDYRFTLKGAAVRKAVSKIGEDIMPPLFVVKQADIQAQSLYKKEEKMEELAEVEKIYEEILTSQSCLNLKSLAVNGQDLMKVGIPAGKQLGLILNELLFMVLEEPELNDKNKLLDIVKAFTAAQDI